MPDSLNSRVARFEADVELAHQLVHGPAGTLPTESGPLRTFAGLQQLLLSQFNAELTRTEVQQNRDTAVAAAGAAQAAQAGADLARDAAQLAAGVYPDVAAGLAAIADGDYFSVPSAHEAEHLVLYRRSGAAAVEIKRYPSAAALAGINTLLYQLSASLIATQSVIAERLAFT